jgi:hypothetical protein
LSTITHVNSRGTAAPVAFIALYALAVVALIPASVLTPPAAPCSVSCAGWRTRWPVQ